MNEEDEFTDKALISHEHEMAPDATEPATPVELDALSDPRSGIAKPARTRAARKLVTTLTLSSRTCRWPIGDPAKADFHYCGEPPQSGRVYCGTHDSMSYQAPQRRKPS